MTTRLGWTRAGRDTRAMEGVRFVACGDVYEVISDRPLVDRDRLGMQQACYRAFDAFLPDSAGKRDHDALLTRLEHLEGCGQLRLELKQGPAAATQAVAPSGRAHLQNLCRKAASSEAWFAAARANLAGLSSDLAAREMRLSRRPDALLADLLVPDCREADLAGRLDQAVVAANGLSGQLTISGLWAPFAFAEPSGVSRG